MPDIHQIIRNMIDAGEDEASIAAVIRHHESINLPDKTPAIPPAPFTGSTARPVSDLESGTFWGGVTESLRSGEALGAGWKSLKGFAKGAIADIPSTIKGTVSDAYEAFSDPIRTIREAPGAFRHGVPAVAREMRDITARAGSDPEAFGRMMGQLTGQPLIGEGVIRGVPMLKTPVSKAAYKTGVSGGLERIGGALGGATVPSVIPTTPRGLATRVATKAGNLAGRPITRTGERMRMRALGVQDPVDLTKPVTGPRRKYTGQPVEPTPPPERNPYTEIFEREGMRQGEADIIPPMVESPNDLAARGGGTAPAYPFEPELPTDIDPIFRNPPKPPPPSGGAPALVKDKVPPVEDQFATMLNEIRQKYNQDPTVELPPPRYSLGAPAAPEQPRFSVRAPRTKVPGKESKAGPPPKGATPDPQKNFKPSTDPNKFAAEDVELLRSQKDRVREILAQMKAKEGDIDTTTGEILEPPQRRAKNWGVTRPESKFRGDYSNEEIGFFGPEDMIDFAHDEGLPDLPPRRFPGDEAFDLGDAGEPINLSNLFERPTASMPDWGPESAPAIPPKKPLTGVNPLRPEVPPGQVTNRRMFELSDQIGAQNKVSPGRQFAESVAPAEFSEDMLLTPVEQMQPEVPRMASPVENRFDPRIAPGGVVSETTPAFADIERRMYELMDKGTSGALTAEEFAEAQALNKTWREHPEFNIKPDDWGDWGGAEKDLPTLVNNESGSTVAAPISAVEPQNVMQVIENIPRTGNIEFDNAVSRLQALRSKARNGLTDSELEQFGNLAEEVRSNPNMPKELEARWKKLGEENAARGPKFKEGDKVKPREQSKATSRPSMFTRFKNKMKDEAGEIGDDVKPRNVPATPSPLASRLVKEGSVVRTKTKDVGPRGQTFSVTGPDGASLGNISVTNERVAEVLKAYGGDGDADQIAKLIYETDLDDILDKAKAKYKNDNMDVSELKIATTDNRKTAPKTAPAPKSEPEPKFDTDTPAEPVDFPNDTFAGPVDHPKPSLFKGSTTAAKEPPPKINPDKDFGPGGNITAILDEAARLDKTGSVDNKYKMLLPREMRGELGPGETYKGKLKNLLSVILEEGVDPEQQMLKLRERDAFIESVRDAVGRENLPIKEVLPNEPLLREKTLPLRAKELRRKGLIDRWGRYRG